MDHAIVIAGCKRGDRHAQKKIFDTYSKSLLLLCKRYVQNDHDAEELLLNGFYKFFASIKQFEYVSDTSLSAWLKRIMVNECLMHLRKAKSIRIVEAESSLDVSLDEEAWANIAAKEILGAISTMPDGYRLVFNLFVIEGYMHGEISAMLGITEGASKSQLMRAKIYLQKALIKKGVVYEKG